MAYQGGVLTHLQDIPLRIESDTFSATFTSNLVPVLHEVRHALQRLRETGESTVVDLSAMPFGPGDEAGLLEIFGTGEVDATIVATGRTQVRETSYAGIWLLEHQSIDGSRLALHVEVADVPQLLRAPREDLDEAQRRLDRRLAELGANYESSTT